VPEKTGGLWYPDGYQASNEEVRRKVLTRDLAEWNEHFKSLLHIPPDRDFDEWSKILTRRQKERSELLATPESVEVEITTKEPIMIGLFGDVHAGGADVDYTRFATDVKKIKEAKGYSVAVGDLTDSYFFGSGMHESLIGSGEQVLYMESALSELAEDGRLIAAWKGDHDGWAEDKMGVRSLYHKFRKAFNAHYLEGVSYLTIKLNNGENVVDYKLVGSHRHVGFSVYNQSHAALRQEKDEARGADVSFTAHKHVKGYNQQAVKEHGGKEHVVHLMSLGAYKASDSYSRKRGYPRADDASMGAFGIVLTPGEKKIYVGWTIEDAVDYLTLLKNLRK